MNKPAYQFPDELKVDAALPDEPELKVEVVDDTPPEDRNRVPLPKEIVDDLENDDLEEYSEKVKQRLKQMKKAFHDERREKEKASRDKEEALIYAQRAFEENKLIKQRLGQGEKIFKTEVTKAATTELQAAKDNLARAYEAADGAKIADAQVALNDAQLKLRDYERFQPSLQEEPAGVQPSQQSRAQPSAASQPDAKSQAWQQKNTWFGDDEEMTALALGLHEKLVRSGVDPRSDDYYRRIDETMKKRFPENFEDDATQVEEPPKTAKTPPRKTAPTVVTPVTRSTAPRQVRLTPSQVSLAKRLGLTNEAYARELVRLENTNG